MSTRIIMGRDLAGYPVNYWVERPLSDVVVIGVVSSVLDPMQILVPELQDIAFLTYTTGTNAFPAVLVSNQAASPPGLGGTLLLEDGDHLLLEDGDNILLEGSNNLVSYQEINPPVLTVHPGETLFIQGIVSTNTYVSVSFYNRTDGASI